VVAVAVGVLSCTAADPREDTSSTEAAPRLAATTSGPSTSMASTSIASTTTELTTTTTSTVVPRATTTTSTVPTTTPYQVPVKDVAAAGWGTAHAGYSATDVFAPCDAEIVSPVNGVALEVRTVDGWDPAVDDPATRGGRSIALLGDDGVRYYMAHFESIDPAILVGGRVGVGDFLGTVGQTGRASACHVHFGISPPCPTTEWSVRRGAIWPHPYLDAWRVGEQLSPVEEVERWVSDNPTACADAAAVNGG
jgi:murein DD-endopeptidase MepM/ murein hydrolase activator NlpD